MIINAAKTKVMLFGYRSDAISIKIQDTEIEKVTRYKYLGVILDPLLDFGLQVDYAVSKAKRAQSKICTLINGRQGISVQLGIQLYKTLVRTHLEYAIPAWANISDKDLEKLEKVQVQCLRRVIGAKAHSSSCAVEVICGTVPMRFRKRELCCREYIRIQTKENGNDLLQLMETSIRSGLRFCPLEYIKVVSREMVRALDGHQVVSSQRNDCDGLSSDTISIMNFNHHSNHNRDVSPSGSVATQSNQRDIVENFILRVKDECITVYTDGSVYSGTTGCGACSAILYSPAAVCVTRHDSRAVGRMVSCTECEIEGILLGMDSVLEYVNLNQQSTAHTRTAVYLFCDSVSAIEAVYKRDSCLSSKCINRLNALCPLLAALGLRIFVLHIPAHCGLQGNIIADKYAKDTAFIQGTQR